MTTKDRILDDAASLFKQNPWQPYTGPAGGQGWLNVQTGEVRYQDERPTDGTAGEAAAGDEVHPYDQPFDPEAEGVDTAEMTAQTPANFAEGDPILAEVDGELVHGETKRGIGGDISVRTDDGETVSVDWEGDDHLFESPAEPPPEGWADGWGEAPPIPDLEGGQTVELYDPESGEYIQGEVRFAEDDPETWGEAGYVHVDGEDGEIYEIAPDLEDGGDDAILTAAEQVMPVAEEDIDDDWSPTDHEMGDYVAAYDEERDEIVAGEIVEADFHNVVIETADGEEVVIDEDNLDMHVLDEAAAFAHRVDAAELLTDDALENVGPSTPDSLADWEGDLVELDHPAAGQITGEVVSGEADDWIYVDSPAFDEPVGIPLDDDHPLHQVDVQAAENPYDLFDADADFGQLKAGDRVAFYSGFDEGLMAGRVTDVGTEGDVHVETDDGQYAEYAIEGDDVEMADLSPGPRPPEGIDEWEEIPTATDIKAGDTVWYEDEAGDLQAAQVEERSGYDPEATLHLDNGDTVTAREAGGYADTGEALPESTTDPGGVETSEYVEVAIRQSDGTLDTIEGVVTEASYGDFRVLDTDGDEHYVNYHDNEVAVTDHDYHPDWDDFLVEDLTGAPADEAAETVLDDFGGAAALDYGDGPMPDDEKRRLRSTLSKYYPPEAVNQFYECMDRWKSDSGSSYAGELEAAFARANGVAAPTRDGYRPDADMVAVAEVATELSRRQFEQVYGDSATVYRGTSDTAMEAVVDQWLEDPKIDEYDLEFLAMNNHTTKKGTAESFGGQTAVIGFEATSDDVLSMNDGLFSFAHEHENEIGIHGDGQAAPAELVEFKDGSGFSMDRTPEEFGEHELDVFADWAEYGFYDRIDRDGMYSEAQMETWMAVADELDARGQGRHTQLVEDIRQKAAEEYGLTSGVDPRLPEGITDPAQFREGMEIEYVDPYGDVSDADIVGVHDEGDVIEVEDYVTGETYQIDPTDVSDVVYSSEPFGENADKLDLEVQPDDVSELDSLYVRGSGGQVVEATVLNTDGSEVEVKLPNGLTDHFDLADDYDQARVGPTAETVGRPLDFGDITAGSTIVAEVPGAYQDEYGETQVMEVESREGDKLNVDYDQVPWLDKPDADSVVMDTVQVLEQDVHESTYEGEGSLGDAGGSDDLPDAWEPVADPSTIDEGEWAYVETVDGPIDAQLDGYNEATDIYTFETANNTFVNVGPEDILGVESGAAGGGEWEPVSGAGDLEPGETVRYQTETMDDPAEATVETINPSGSVELDDGKTIVSHAVPDAVEVQSDGAEGSADDDGGVNAYEVDDGYEAVMYGPDDSGEDLVDHYVQYVSGGEHGEGKVVEADAGTLTLDDGTQVEASAVTQRSQVDYPDSGGSADELSGPDDVDQGERVLFTEALDGDPYLEGEVMNVSESGVQVQTDDGYYAAVDWDQIAPVESEGSDDTASPDLDDYGLLPNEGITFDTEDGTAAGYVEYVNADGEFVVQTPELDDDTVTVDPADVHEPLDDPSEGDADAEFVAGDPIATPAFSLFEEIPIQMDGETQTFEVVETAPDSDAPVELRAGDGQRYLFWPDGEIEEV